MENIEMKVEKGKMILTIDLKKRGKESTSGKSIIVATTGGNQPVPGDGYEKIRFGLNVYEYKNDKK